MDMLETETVTAVIATDGAANAFGETAREVRRIDVPNVLVAPGATSDLDASRPNGAKVSYTLYLPKSFGGSLRGCSFEVRGTEYAVVGNPQRYTDGNLPLGWNMVVEVGRVDG